MGERLTKKCLHCGKTKTMKFFTKTPFLKDGYELYCRDCKKKIISNLDDLKDYLKQHNIQFNQDCWNESWEYVRKRELKKYINDNLPPNIEDIILSKSVGKYFSLYNLSGKWEATPFNTNVEIKSGDIEVSGEMINKWGSGYDPKLYDLFEQKYRRLSNTYQLPTESHKEFLIKACVCSVKADLAMAENDVKSAKEWMTMFKDTTSAGKLQPSQMSKADLSMGMDTFGQLTRMAEEAVDIIPILPQFKKRPKDLPDFNIWCWINYVRNLQGLPLCTYEEVYKFYEDRKKDYLESGFIEEEL